LVFRPEPNFDYDFENFFPQDDPDLNFYREVFEKEFGSDNDYLLLALNNPGGNLWDSAFLTRSVQITQEVRSLAGVDTLISIFDLEFPKMTPFGWQSFPVFEGTGEEELNRSKRNLQRFRGSLLAKDGSSLLFLIQNDPKLSKEQGDKLYEEILDVFSKNGQKPLAIAGKIQTQRDFVNLMQEEFRWFLELHYF
jgi:predicted RND superfamily exporter protein